MRARVKDVHELFEELTPDDKDDEFDDDDDDNDDKQRNVFVDLIETYNVRFEESYRDVKNMLETLETATEINATMLDEKRNRIQLLSLYINVITLGVALGTLLTGMFGMNLLNGWEGSYAAFVTVCMMAVIIIGLSLALVKFVNFKVG